MEQKHTPIESCKSGAPLTPPVPIPAVKPLDKVKPPTRKSRTWERER